MLSGFAVAVAPFFLLMAGAVAGLLHMRDDMETLVRQHHQRTDLTYVMRMVVRERVFTLYSMVQARDSFEISAARERYIHLADEFLRAREQMRAADMSAGEQAELNEALKLISRTAPMQNQIIDLVDADRGEEGLALLAIQVVPIQNQIFSHFQKMLELQNHAMNRAIEDARWKSNLILWIFIVSCGAAMLVSLLAIWRSVTRTREIEDKLFREKERAEVTLHSMTDGVLTADEAGRVDGINSAAERLLGWAREQVLGKRLRDVYPLFDVNSGEALNCVGCHELTEDSEEKPYYLLKGMNGRECIIQDAVGPIYDRDGEVIGAVVVFRDVSHAWRRVGQISWRAAHDAQTGLINRAELERELGVLVRDAQAEGGRHVLLFMDLDRFKAVNDECGHAAGDELLRQVADMISRRGRDTDIVARLGGDEFAMLVQGCPIEQGLRLAEEIRRDIELMRFHWDDKAFEVGVSIGVAAVTADSGDAEIILRHADEACTQAKQRGRNCVQVWQEGGLRDFVEQGWKPRLLHALEHDGFTLYFQKQIPLLAREDGKLRLEMLLRMRDESGGLVLPGVFLSSAERFGLMPAIDSRMLESTVAILVRQWRQAGGKWPGRMPVCALNLSVASLIQDGFAQHIEQVVMEAGIPPGTLCFEIPESAVTTHFSRVSAFMARVSALGCCFALDNVCGVLSAFDGYKNLPLCHIKIDPMLAREAAHGQVSRTMFEAIVQVAHLMGIQVVVGRVESESSLSLLREFGVDYVQGFALHSPEPVARLDFLGE